MLREKKKIISPEEFLSWCSLHGALMGRTSRWERTCCPITYPDPEIEMTRGMGCHWHFPWEMLFTDHCASTLWTWSGARQASCTAQTLATERIGYHIHAPSQLLGLALHVSEKCKRSIANAPEKATIFYPLMQKVNKGDSLSARLEATNLEWAKRNLHHVYLILQPKFWDVEKSHSVLL